MMILKTFSKCYRSRISSALAAKLCSIRCFSPNGLGPHTACRHQLIVSSWLRMGIQSLTTNMARILGEGVTNVNIPHERIDEYIFRNLGKQGPQIVMTNASTGKSTTANDTIQIAERWAAGLRSLGYKKGDIVSMYCLNSEEFVFLTLASLRLGMTVNPINPAATAYELRHYLAEVQPAIILTEDVLLKNLNAALDVINNKPRLFSRQNVSNIHVHGLGEVYTQTGDVVNKSTGNIDVEEDVAFIFFSSGTSGLPKAVMLTHYNVVSSILFRQLSGMYPPSVRTVLLVFPMFHAGGFFSGCPGFNAGSVNVIFFEAFNLQLFLKMIDNHKPQFAMLPPTIMVNLSKVPDLDRYDTSSIKYIMTGAAPVRAETEDALKTRLNGLVIIQGYGMTEAVLGVVYRSEKDNLTAPPGACGKVSFGAEIKIISPHTGETLGPNQRGEICIRGPFIMKGYMNNVDATKATVDRDGWLHSGDLGYYDDYEYIYIVDRLKELIKYKGNQVAPAELEAAILDYPDVAEVGVIGIPHAEAGEVPRAYVVIKEGSNPSADDIHKYVNERVSYYKQLRGGVVFLEELPKLQSGKILRRKLREMAKTESKL